VKIVKIGFDLDFSGNVIMKNVYRIVAGYLITRVVEKPYPANIKYFGRISNPSKV